MPPCAANAMQRLKLHVRRAAALEAIEDFESGDCCPLLCRTTFRVHSHTHVMCASAPVQPSLITKRRWKLDRAMPAWRRICGACSCGWRAKPHHKLERLQLLKDHYILRTQ